MLIYDKYLESLKNDTKTFQDWRLHEGDGGDPLDLISENDPKDADSLGVLINKLNCATIQMWHNQEIMYTVRRMGPHEFESVYGKNLPHLQHIVKRSCDLNVQRARLVDAIDRKAFEIGTTPMKSDA